MRRSTLWFSACMALAWWMVSKTWRADLVRAIRELVGPDLPIAASFDLHGNVTQEMADLLDGTFACHHYPHVDLHERAAEAVALVVRMVRRRDSDRPAS